jgi:hypothetical protein
MPSPEKANRPRRTARSPLSAMEVAFARRVAGRLRAELTSTLQSLPRKYLSPGQMSRDLRVNRTVCHRLMTSLEAGKDDLALLMGLPGVQGLRQCIRAMERHGADPGRIASAEAAVEQFAQLVADLGGSHARLSARLSLSAPADDASGKGNTPHASVRRTRVREQLFEAAAWLMGRRTEARCGISLIRPSPARPSEIEYAHVRFFSELRANPDATPLVIASSIAPDGDGPELPVESYRTLDGAPMDARARNSIIAPFTSDPLPMVTARDISGRLTHLIDPRPESSRRRLDIAVGYMVPSLCPIPATQEVPILLEAIHMREPSAAMVFDVYLHSSLAAGCRPSISAYVGRNSGLHDIIDRWYDRVEDTPVLKLLGPGLANAASPMAPHLDELTEHVFTRLGWNPAEFLGYRCEESFPLWGCDYVMAFDYRRDPAAGPQAERFG